MALPVHFIPRSGNAATQNHSISTGWDECRCSNTLHAVFVKKRVKKKKKSQPHAGSTKSGKVEHDGKNQGKLGTQKKEGEEKVLKKGMSEALFQFDLPENPPNKSTSLISPRNSYLCGLGYSRNAGHTNK